MEKMTNRMRRWKSIVGFQLRVVRGWLCVGYGNRIGRRCFLFRHRIKAAGMPRMALCQPHRTHRAATQHTVFANGVSGVLRAAWEKATTLTQHRSHAVLIGFDEAEGRDLTEIALVGGHAVAEGAGRGGCNCAATETAAAAADFATSRSRVAVHSAMTEATSLVVMDRLKRTTYCDGCNAF